MVICNYSYVKPCPKYYEYVSDAPNKVCSFFLHFVALLPVKISQKKKNQSFFYHTSKIFNKYLIKKYIINRIRKFKNCSNEKRRYYNFFEEKDRQKINTLYLNSQNFGSDKFYTTIHYTNNDDKLNNSKNREPLPNSSNNCRN